MKITQDVREYAAQKEIDEQAAFGVGMKEKSDKQPVVRECVRLILSPAKSGLWIFWEPRSQH